MYPRNDSVQKINAPEIFTAGVNYMTRRRNICPEIKLQNVRAYAPSYSREFYKIGEKLDIVRSRAQGIRGSMLHDEIVLNTQFCFS
jgi:hypothetical protein